MPAKLILTGNKEWITTCKKVLLTINWIMLISTKFLVVSNKTFYWRTSKKTQMTKMRTFWFGSIVVMNEFIYPSSFLSTFVVIDFHTHHFRTYDCFLIRARTTSDLLHVTPPVAFGIPWPPVREWAVIAVAVALQAPNGAPECFYSFK